MSQFYTKGTIKIKNADGVLEPFYPNTKEDCVTDISTGTSLSTIIENMEEDIEVAANSGGVKICYDNTEGIEETSSEYSNESLIALISIPDVPSDTWQIVVDTRLYDSSQTNKISAIPFNLTGQSITLTVDWGDGNISTINSSNYSNNDSTASQHTYATAGVYTIKIKSDNWANTYFTNTSLVNWTSTYNNKLNFLTYFRQTLIKIESAIPGIAGIKYWASVSSNLTTKSNSLEYFLFHSSKLNEIVPTLFKRCVNITIFNSCFRECSSLTELPQDLFKHNTAVIYFNNCFDYCTSLASLPQDLFKYNNVIKYMDMCFYGCSSLNDFKIHIGSTSISSIVGFIANKAGTTRIVYVPNNSTTQTNFNSVASSLGLTIIGE